MDEKQKAALSALVLAALTVLFSLEIIYAQVRLGTAASFHFHKGLAASMLSVYGIFYTSIAAITAWRKIGLSHIAGVITSIALAQAMFNTTTLYKTEAAIVSATLLVFAGVWALRRSTYAERPLWWLVFITWVSTIYQSAVYRLLIPNYVLPGVLIFKTAFILSGAGLLWAALNREDSIQ